MAQKRTELIFILLGAFLCCFMAFFNGFPLVFSDTGTYINSGFDGIVPYDRPIFYGLFLRHVSLAASLWLVVLVQGLLISSMLMACVGLFYAGSKKLFVFLSCLLTLVLFTGLSRNVSILLPDIFSSISVLCIVFLLLHPAPSWFQWVSVSFLLFLSLAVHSSNLLSVTALLLLLTGYAGIRKFRKQSAVLNPRRLLLCFALLLCTLLVVPSVHFAFGRKFTYSQGSHVFLMNHLIETGILKSYLEKEGLNKNYALSKYKNELGGDFIWGENSPLKKMGGWDSTKTEFNAILHDVLTTPKYESKLAQRGFEYSLKQYFYFDLGKALVYLDGSAPYGQITWRFHQSEGEYVSSKQNRGLLDFCFTNKTQEILVLAGLCLLAIVLFIPAIFQNLPLTLKWFLLIVVLFTILNAVVCANLSGVTSRYQDRVIWLVPFSAMLAGVWLWEEKVKMRKP